VAPHDLGSVEKVWVRRVCPPFHRQSQSWVTNCTCMFYDVAALGETVWHRMVWRLMGNELGRMWEGPDKSCCPECSWSGRRKPPKRNSSHEKRSAAEYQPRTSLLRRLVWRSLYRVIKKSLCSCFLYCNHQVHRDFLITLYFEYGILHYPFAPYLKGHHNFAKGTPFIVPFFLRQLHRSFHSSRCCHLVVLWCITCSMLSYFFSLSLMV